MYYVIWLEILEQNVLNPKRRCSRWIMVGSTLEKKSLVCYDLVLFVNHYCRFFFRLKGWLPYISCHAVYLCRVIYVWSCTICWHYWQQRSPKLCLNSPLAKILKLIYRNASNKRHCAYWFSELEGVRLFEGGRLFDGVRLFEVGRLFQKSISTKS